MQKAPIYDWKDSNVSLIGSKFDKELRLESAQTEPAWKNCGQKEGLMIWRIEKFKVVPVEKESYGSFYQGDSYIVLNTYKKEEKFLYDVHFWIGQESTQDEYCIAAYKTVELDVFLQEIPIQHREVQHHETDLFKSYFKELIYLKGGIDSGFQRVTPSSYKPRMFIIHSLNKKLITEEIGLSRENLNSDDSFILDLGEELYVLQGKNSQAQEKYQANITAGKIKAERMGQCKVEVVTEEEWSTSEVVKGVPEGGEKFERRAGVEKAEKILLRLRDKENLNTPVLEEISKSEFKYGMLDQNDVFFLFTASRLFIWVGELSSVEEKRNSLNMAHNYLKSHKSFFLPITVVRQGKENKDFLKEFN